MSGCDRELNAHFYSAASLMYHVPDTWHDTTPSHIILTLGRPVLALPLSLSAKRGAASTIFTTLVCRGPGSNPWPPVPQRGHSTHWAIGAGKSESENPYDSSDTQLIKIQRCKFHSTIIWLTPPTPSCHRIKQDQGKGQNSSEHSEHINNLYTLKLKSQQLVSLTDKKIFNSF